MKRSFFALAVFSLFLTLVPFTGAAQAALRALPAPLRGVTLDDVSNANAIVSSFKSMSNMPTARLVFDEFVPAPAVPRPGRRLPPRAVPDGNRIGFFFQVDVEHADGAHRLRRVRSRVRLRR